MNGDLSAGLEGWIVEGRDAPALLGPGARLVGNLTLVSPPLLVPPGAQTLRIAARASGGGGLVEVRARPDDGTPDLPLAALEPGAARRSFPVGVAALAGRTVRIVLDPVPALGTSVDLLRVGPLTAPLPGWSVVRGGLEVTGARGRRVVAVADEPLELRSPPYAIGAGRRPRSVSVDVRGRGLVRVGAGGRTRTAAAGPRWRRVSVVLPPRQPRRIVLTVRATPREGGLELRALGRVQPSMRRA